MEKSEKQPNEKLRYFREIRGWSQRYVAERIGTGETEVSRWECGARKPSRYYQTKLCELFEKTAQELGFMSVHSSDFSVEIAPSIQQSQQIFRIPTQVNLENMSFDTMSHTAMESLFTEILSPDLELTERLMLALQSSPQLDEVILTNLENIIKDRRYAFVLSEGANWYTIYQEVRGCLHFVVQLLEKNPSHSRLRLLVGETALLLGDLLFNAGVSSAAERYYRVALEASKEHALLQTVILGRQALLPIYDHRPQDTLPLIEKAQQVAPTTTPDITLAWLSAIAGEAYASIGQHTACFQSLDAAERLLERGRSGDISLHFQPEIAYATFSQTKFIGYKGICFLRLNQATKAQSLLHEQLIAAEAQGQVHHKSIALIDLAMSFVQQASIGSAIEYATQALRCVEQTKSLRVLQRLMKLRQALEPWKNMARMCRFDEQLSFILSNWKETA